LVNTIINLPTSQPTNCGNGGATTQKIPTITSMRWHETIVWENL